MNASFQIWWELGNLIVFYLNLQHCPSYSLLTQSPETAQKD